MAKVSVHIVTWNGARYLPDLFSTLKQQTFPDVQTRVVDNASDDESVRLVQEQGDITLIRNARNLGFSAAHNQAIRLAIDKWEGEDLDHCYVLVTNQDIILTPTTIEKLVDYMEAHPEVGSAQGKVRKAYIEHAGDDFLAETVCADIIDSAGLRGTPSRRFVDRGAGEMDTGQLDDEEYIFGPTGAIALYRASALQSIRYGDDFFDSDFFLYKEDIDLAWRLQHAGWKSAYVPSSVSYHHRGLYGREKSGVIERIRNRRSKRPMLATLSSRNHYFVLLKNLPVSTAVFAGPLILVSLGGQFLYSLVLEPHVVKGLFKGLGQVPDMLKKRRVIQKGSTCRARDLKLYFTRR